MNTYLAHHGIMGQKWGVRRFQNEDGSLTPEGEERYRQVASSKYEQRLSRNHALYHFSGAQNKNKNRARYADKRRERAAKAYEKAANDDERSKLKSEMVAAEIEARMSRTLEQIAKVRWDQIKSNALKPGIDYVMATEAKLDDHGHLVINEFYIEKRKDM